MRGKINLFVSQKKNKVLHVLRGVLNKKNFAVDSITCSDTLRYQRETFKKLIIESILCHIDKTEKL